MPTVRRVASRRSLVQGSQPAPPERPVGASRAPSRGSAGGQQAHPGAGQPTGSRPDGSVGAQPGQQAQPGWARQAPAPTVRTGRRVPSRVLARRTPRGSRPAPNLAGPRQVPAKPGLHGRTGLPPSGSRAPPSTPNPRAGPSRGQPSQPQSRPNPQPPSPPRGWAPPQSAPQSRPAWTPSQQQSASLKDARMGYAPPRPGTGAHPGASPSTPLVRHHSPALVRHPSGTRRPSPGCSGPKASRCPTSRRGSPG